MTMRWIGSTSLNGQRMPRLLALAFALTGVFNLSGRYIEPMDMVFAFLIPVAVAGVGLVWLRGGWRRVRSEQSPGNRKWHSARKASAKIT